MMLHINPTSVNIHSTIAHAICPYAEGDVLIPEPLPPPLPLPEDERTLGATEF
jgi:hypothetical protein